MISKTFSLLLIWAFGLSSALVISGTPATAQQTAQSRTITPAAVTGDLPDIRYTYDGRLDTRAYSSRANYVGMSVTIDSGSLQNIIGVKQEFGRWPTHYPGAYRVEVAESASGPWMTAFEGPGKRGESLAEFRAILSRYIRITATARNPIYNVDWSIAELKIGVDPGQNPRRIPAGPRPSPRPPTPEDRTLRDLEMARDGNLNTRATSGTADYSGMQITIDLGGEYEVSRIAQVHGRWADDYPREYKVELSRQRDETRFQEVWRGPGAPRRSVARFEPTATRYVRITALRERDRTHWWSIAELRTNREEDVVEDDDGGRLEREIRGATARGLTDPAAAADHDASTRATTNSPNYVGSWLQVDLGGSYTISRVVQIHNPSDEDYPARYRIEVSEDGRNRRTVYEGRGEPSRSSASFPPVRARYVRIIALNNRDNRHWWSIQRLSVRE